MNDAQYERMQAIKDFLLAQVSLQNSTTKAEELEEMAIAIQINYYWYF